MKRWVLALVLAAGWADAKVDLVTLPNREKVQVTIYNSADMTLVRDSRILTLKKGSNRLQFSWANTLIDPTSLEMLPLEQGDKVSISSLVYPARTQNVGVWEIESEISAKIPVEITYLTSGLSWRAFYMGTLSADEKTMVLEGYVRVSNNSGEEYDGAQTRVIVGKVHLLDQIAELARRQYPYGSPQPLPPAPSAASIDAVEMVRAPMAMKGMAFARASELRDRKEIVKEGLSEYFLYTIEGEETIPEGWSKRLPSMTAAGVPVVNLYKYEEERWGQGVVRFLSFKNDKAHKLGETPIPDGLMRVYRDTDKEGHLSYEGQSAFKYIPVDEKAELNLGTVQNVVVEPKLMDYKTANHTFDGHGDVNGWDEIREWKIEVKNTRDVPVKIEVQRNFPTQHWSLREPRDGVTYAKVDLDTAKFTLELPPRTVREFDYTLTTRHGRRETER